MKFIQARWMVVVGTRMLFIQVGGGVLVVAGRGTPSVKTFSKRDAARQSYPV